MSARPVTLKAKCYTFICLGCGLLAQSERSDAVTCSPACRVRAHRNGAAAENRLLAKKIDVPIGMMGQVKAVITLRPDLAERIRIGEIEVDDAETQREMFRSFHEHDHHVDVGEHHPAPDRAQEGTA